MQFSADNIDQGFQRHNWKVTFWIKCYAMLCHACLHACFITDLRLLGLKKFQLNIIFLGGLKSIIFSMASRSLALASKL